MAIKRDKILKNAEKLVQKGKLEQAIRESSNTGSHGETRRFEDINAINDFLPNLKDDPRIAGLTDQDRRLIPLLGGQAFRILYQRSIGNVIKFRGTDHHRPDERTSTHFVHTHNSLCTTQDRTVALPQRWVQGHLSTRGCQLEIVSIEGVG